MEKKDVENHFKPEDKKFFFESLEAEQIFLYYSNNCENLSERTAASPEITLFDMKLVWLKVKL